MNPCASTLRRGLHTILRMVIPTFCFFYNHASLVPVLLGYTGTVSKYLQTSLSHCSQAQTPIVIRLEPVKAVGGVGVKVGVV